MQDRLRRAAEQPRLQAGQPTRAHDHHGGLVLLGHAGDRLCDVALVLGGDRLGLQSRPGRGAPTPARVPTPSPPPRAGRGTAPPPAPAPPSPPGSRRRRRGSGRPRPLRRAYSGLERRAGGAAVALTARATPARIWIAIDRTGW